METEIAVEHPKFDGYSYKFKILGETECQVFKVFKGGREKCLERGTFSKQQLMYDWINMKVGVFDKDLEKKANPKPKNKKHTLCRLKHSKTTNNLNNRSDICNRKRAS